MTTLKIHVQEHLMAQIHCHLVPDLVTRFSDLFPVKFLYIGENYEWKTLSTRVTGLSWLAKPKGF